MDRDSRHNYCHRNWLRRHEPRSRFPPKPPFRPLFGAFYPHPAHKSGAGSGSGHPLSGTRETWLGWRPTSLWPLFSRSTLHASRLPPHAPRPTPDQRGEVVRRRFPAGHCLTPTVELAKTERGPISTSGPFLSMAAHQAIPPEKSISFVASGTRWSVCAEIPHPGGPGNGTFLRGGLSGG